VGVGDAMAAIHRVHQIVVTNRDRLLRQQEISRIAYLIVATLE
jgi:hypothetical protein